MLGGEIAEEDAGRGDVRDSCGKKNGKRCEGC